MKRRCICCVAFGGWYPRGMARLYRSLSEQGFVGGRHFYADELPLGCPEHSDVPYAFKIAAIRTARDAGFEQVVWADASMYAIAPVDPLFAELDRRGYLLFKTPHTSATWTHDKALAHYGFTRDQAVGIPQVVGGLCGFDFTTGVGEMIFSEWESVCENLPQLFRGAATNDDRKCSADPRCKGHRHDQSILSLIAHTHGLTTVTPPRLYTWQADDPASDTVMVNRGM